MIYFQNRKAEELYKTLTIVLPDIVPVLKRSYKHVDIFIFDTIYDGRVFDALARKTNSRNIISIFKKDDYIFIGPYMESLQDACPFCFLLTLAVDGAELKKIYSRSSSVLHSKYPFHVPLKNVTRYVHCIDTSGGRVSYFTNPLMHPACGHLALKGRQKFSINTSRRTVRELLSTIKNKHTGIIRDIKSLKNLTSPLIKSKMGPYEIVFCWFQNPVFPVYPQVGFLDLAIGTDVSYTGALRRAVYESLERYSVLCLPQEASDAYGSFPEIKKNAVDPGRFWQYAKEQLKVKNFPFTVASDTSKFRWTKTFNFLGEEALVPEDYIYVNMKHPSIYHNNTTSGCAAHTDFYMACFNAMLEIIERDNIMRHWASGKPVSHVDVSGLTGVLKERITFIRTLGYEIRTIDCSRFDGIFTYVILLKNTKKIRPYVIITSGCHVEPEQAILKALREALGSLFISMVLERRNGPNILSREHVTDPEDHAIFYRDPGNFRILSHYYNPASQYALGDVRALYKGIPDKTILRRMTADLKRAGVDMFLRDVTFHPLKKLGVHVVRAISPELMPIIFGTHYLKLGGSSGEDFSYHPQALKYPHPFS